MRRWDHRSHLYELQGSAELREQPIQDLMATKPGVCESSGVENCSPQVEDNGRD
jgi:hypothetical protein